MTFVTEKTPLQRGWLLLAVPLVLLIALVSIPTASAEEAEWNTVIVEVASQRVDIDGDGSLEAFSADFSVNLDGTAAGEFYLDSGYEFAVIDGTVEVSPDGELTVVVNGAAVDGGAQYDLSFSPDNTHVNTGGGGSNGDIDDILFDIIDSVTGSSNSVNIWTQISLQ